MPANKREKKPEKPRPDFPLFAHASGQWCKTIRGKHYYFGIWDDWQAAEKRYAAEKDDLYAGRTPSRGDGLTVRDLVNHFLTYKQGQVNTGEIAQGTFDDYYENCERVLKVFGRTTHVENLRPLDFETLRADFAKTHGPETLKGDVACTRALFNYCDDTFGIRVRWGKNFSKPSRTVLRKHRKTRPSRMYTPVQLRSIIEAADPQLRAMVYLGLNCGFGNRDCAMLTRNVIDFRTGWIDYARNKTGIDRRCPLWQETVKALKVALAERPTPKVDCDNVFITKYGNIWIGGKNGTKSEDDPVSQAFTKLLVELKLKRTGVSFYALRHVFYTVGKKHDKDAAKAIMGHAENSNDMGVFYDEEPIDDTRLKAVTNYIRSWLLKKTR